MKKKSTEKGIMKMNFSLKNVKMSIKVKKKIHFLNALFQKYSMSP